MPADNVGSDLPTPDLDAEDRSVDPGAARSRGYRSLVLFVATLANKLGTKLDVFGSGSLPVKKSLGGEVLIAICPVVTSIPLMPESEL